MFSAPFDIQIPKAENNHQKKPMTNSGSNAAPPKWILGQPNYYFSMNPTNFMDLLPDKNHSYFL